MTPHAIGSGWFADISFAFISHQQGITYRSEPIR